MQKLLGEYPVNPEVDGFIKRLFDYAEFERYEETDILRYQSQLLTTPRRRPSPKSNPK